MAESERAILDFYQLSTPYPSEWPDEKNDDDDDSGEEDLAKKAILRKSRYQALERVVSGRRSVVVGSDGRKGGNLSDEPDPLGASGSMMRQLKEIGAYDDVRLRMFSLPPNGDDVGIRIC
jgi:exocyst complex component 2